MFDFRTSGGMSNLSSSSVYTAFNTTQTTRTANQQRENGRFYTLTLYLSPVYIPLSCVLIFFSIITIYTICRDYNMRNTPSTIFVGNLALTDLCLALFTAVTVLLRITGVDYPTLICELQTAAYTGVTALSLLFTFANSVHRYIFIRFPLKYHHVVTLQRTQKIVVSIWIFSILLSLVPMFLDFASETHCDTLSMSKIRRYGAICPLTLLYVICSFISLGIYVSLFRVIRKKQLSPRYSLPPSLVKDASYREQVVSTAAASAPGYEYGPKNGTAPEEQHREEQTMRQIEECILVEDKSDTKTITIFKSATVTNVIVANSNSCLGNTLTGDDRNDINFNSLPKPVLKDSESLPTFTNCSPEIISKSSLSQQYISCHSSSSEGQFNLPLENKNQRPVDSRLNRIEITPKTEENSHTLSTESAEENYGIEQTSLRNSSGTRCKTNKYSNIFNKYSRRDLRTAKLLFILLGVYIILWSPTYVILFLHSFYYYPLEYCFFAHMMSMINSVIDFFIYPMKVTRIRSSLLYSLKNSFSCCSAVINWNSSASTSNDRSLQ